MKSLIDGIDFKYINNALRDEAVRTSYFQLVQQIYGLDFEKWFQSGHWDNRFIPYIIMHKEKVISSVAVCINDIVWMNQRKRYLQISTVMTLPEYRNKGFNRFLMDAVISEWNDKCDSIYLLANDSVVNFYPKFDFEKFYEYQYSKSIINSDGVYRRLDIEDPDDWRLILKKYLFGNPFSEITVDNKSLFIFHCLNSFSKNIYYIEKYDAVVIVKFENNILNCYDIFTDNNIQLDAIISVMADKSTKVTRLGFTPKSKEHYSNEILLEPDTHLFVLKGKENIFNDNRIMFPLLSRA